MPGTRQATLTKATEWISGGHEPILWLSGIAGTGKSAVMSSLFEIFDNHTTRLAAFIRFDRAEFSDASLFVRALAYQLAVFDSRLGQAISEVLIRRPQIISHPQLSAQFNILVRGPLQKYPDLNREGPIVVLVDGLDECTGEMRKQLLDLFSNSDATFKHFPFLRIIISSRPEEDIHTAFQDCTHIHPFPLDTASPETKADIEFFITGILSKSKSADFRAMCEMTDAISKLSQRASGLFIWASVAVSYILKSPLERLQQVLDVNDSLSSLKTLDILYKTALNSVLDEITDEDIQRNARAILGAIMALSRVTMNIPLTTPILTSLLAHLDVTRINGFLDKLRSVMITANDNTSAIKLMHKSLDDFLTDKNRCGMGWYICLQDEYRNAAVACLSEVHAWLDNPDPNSRAMSSSLEPRIRFAFDAIFVIFVGTRIKSIPSETVLYAKLQSLFSVYLLRWYQAPFSNPYYILSKIQESLRSSIVEPSLVRAHLLPLFMNYFLTRSCYYSFWSSLPHSSYILGIQAASIRKRLSECSDGCGSTGMVYSPNATCQDIGDWLVILRATRRSRQSSYR
jgi:hypothetical protein